MAIRRIVYEKPTGGVAVVRPVRNTFGDEELTDAQIEQRAFAALPADAANPVFVDPADVPDDRTFRAAWTTDMSVDMAKARDVTRDMLRVARIGKFSQKDIEFTRAQEKADALKIAAVVADKNYLRNLPESPEIVAAITPEDLKIFLEAATNKINNL